MSTRNLVLTERQERPIEELVSSGEYQNASERQAVQLGIDDIERGDYFEFSGAEALERNFLKRGEAVIKAAAMGGSSED